MLRRKEREREVKHTMKSKDSVLLVKARGIFFLRLNLNEGN